MWMFVGNAASVSMNAGVRGLTSELVAIALTHSIAALCTNESTKSGHLSSTIHQRFARVLDYRVSR